jgi:hypothetical protein
MLDTVLPLIWQSALLPFGVALALVLACRALRFGHPAVVAVAAGFGASYFLALGGQWSPVPRTAADWLPYAVLVAAAGAIAVERIRGAVPRSLARWALALVVAGTVVGPALQSFGPQKAGLAALAVSVLAALTWSGLAGTGERRAGVRPLLLAVVASGAGLAMMLDSSQSIGQLSGALAAALGACVVFSLPRLRGGFTPAAGGLAVLVLSALLANAHLYAGFPLAYIALLTAALWADPVLAAVRHRGASGAGRSWRVATVLTAVPVAVTVALAVQAMQSYGY